MTDSLSRRLSNALPALRAIFTVAALGLLAACAQPARVTQMTVPNLLAPVVSANPDLQESVAVGEVAGGQTTSPLWTSQVDNPEFREALERSLEFNGILAKKPEAARYTVSVTLNELQQPLMGFDLTVTPRVSYRVVERAAAAEIYSEELTTPFTADFSSSLVAVERLRLANEGAIRESIKRFLTRFGEVWTERKAKTQPSAPAQPTASARPVS